MPEFSCGPARKWMEFRPLNGDNHFTEDEHIFWSHEDESNVNKVPTEWWFESIPGGVRTDLPEDYFTYDGNGIEYGYLLFPASHILSGSYRLCCHIVKNDGSEPYREQWILTVFHAS